MAPPLISILSPFKDSAEHIKTCIDSIVAQSYSQWELIIVDDHSTDQSPELVKLFAQEDDRILLLKNSGSGIIQALRLAFEHSSGELITRMDSDDIMAPQKLMVMAQQLQRHGKGHIALGQVKYFCDGTLGNGYKTYEKWLNQLTATGHNFSEIYKECVIPSPCWMVYRDDFTSCGAFSSSTYPEDYDLAFRFYKKGIICLASNEVLHYWRDYETRTSRTDPNYAENHFLTLKIDYFLDLDRKPSRPLVLWSAGFKGKFCAKILKKKKIPFIWICNNPKKIGKHIYKMELCATSALSNLDRPQVIVAVANKISQKRITQQLEAHYLTKSKDYFFFC